MATGEVLRLPAVANRADGTVEQHGVEKRSEARRLPLCVLEVTGKSRRHGPIDQSVRWGGFGPAGDNVRNANQHAGKERQETRTTPGCWEQELRASRI
jgi:hypothetical protein